MLKFFSVFLFSILPIYSCIQYLEPLVCNSFNGDINVQFPVNGIGTEKTIHKGSFSFLVKPDQISFVHLDLPLKYSLLDSNFYPFNNKINKSKNSIDFEKASAQGFQKQTLFGDAISLSYDYLTASPEGILHDNLMTVYGNFNGGIMKIPISSYAS